MNRANDRIVGGLHYYSPIQHWDYVVANDLGYFEGQITKYVTRWRKKGGLEDLRKAEHFLQKLIEITEQKEHDREAAQMFAVQRANDEDDRNGSSIKVTLK